MRILPILLLLAAALASGPAAAIETRAREAILVDMETGAVLLEKDADRPMPPASMSKIMTAYVVFEALQAGRIGLADTLPVSEKAWRKGGSKMFVEVGSQIPVEDLLRGVIVQSGNDACIVLAEGLAGTEEAFARVMTETGRSIGLRNSVFANSTGWPDPNQLMSVRDLAILAESTIRRFPEYYPYFAEKEFTWHDIRQGNRNPLLYTFPGTDGLKTGHTEEAGYGLTASAAREGRRLILVVTGLGSMKERGEEALRLMEWGFREFDNVTLFQAGQPVVEAEVWLGDEERVPLIAPTDIKVTVGRGISEDVSVKIVYEGPVPAPIAEGQHVADLVVTRDGREIQRMPLFAARAVEPLGPFGKIFAAATYLVFGP